ncbi:MAG: PQQ-binding-like beta-propeller repeat protein [Bryobacteraceae bacterium]
MKTSMPKLVWMLLCFSCLMAAERDTGWSQFRGPDSSGIVESANLPLEFGPEKNVVWKTAVPMGKSSPVFTGDYIFLTGHEAEKLITLCFDRRSGKELWRQAITRERSEYRHKLNDAAAPTPVTDGRHVYVFFADFGLVTYTVGGKEVWRRPMGPFVSLQGVSASPLVIGSRLFMVCDQTRGSFIEALDTVTGKLLWRKDRQPAAAGGYSTPNRFVRNGEVQVVVAGQFGMSAYQPATGETLWAIHGLPGQPKATPVVAGDSVYYSAKGGAESNIKLLAHSEYDKNGDGRITIEEAPSLLSKGMFKHLDTDSDGGLDEKEWGPLRQSLDSKSMAVAIRPGGGGDGPPAEVKWRFERNIPDVPTPLVYRGIVYLVQNGGIVSALDAATGALRKQGRLTQALGDYYASPVAADGKVYMVSQAGKVSTLKADGEWEVLATSDLGEDCYATPALVEGRIYLRTATSLYAFGK